MQVLLPGDPLPSSSSASSSSLHLGPGLSTSTATAAAAKGKGKERADVAATRAGLLGHLEQGDKERWWIEGTLKRYTPQPPEPVLGIIIARHAEGYRVDIGSSQAASLDALAFEGATKRNKPNLKVGTLVYAHLLSTPSFSEPELSCVDPATQKAAGFGELQGGFLIRGVELGRCRALLAPKNPILSTLGARFPFEVAVGMNGRVWVKAAQEDDDEQLVDVIRELRGR
ncbi:exosome non-catalytic core subunit RRP40 [Rhodotorula paludigena]|uniref:exosome non-catalytic core subunit RRP40 n=1 Tax=Rhodotorula paludigena TaxID=86838 RepID=UPI00317ED981